MRAPRSRKWTGKTVMETFDGRPLKGNPDLENRFMIGPRGSIDEQGEPDVLYRNLAGRHFSAIPFTDGAFLDEDGKPLTEAAL